MADYCWDCNEEHMGLEGKDNDFKGLCRLGRVFAVLCEGCGITIVDNKGKCLGGCSDKKHGVPKGCMTIREEVLYGS